MCNPALLYIPEIAFGNFLSPLPHRCGDIGWDFRKQVGFVRCSERLPQILYSCALCPKTRQRSRLPLANLLCQKFPCAVLIRLVRIHRTLPPVRIVEPYPVDAFRVRFGFSEPKTTCTVCAALIVLPPFWKFQNLSNTTCPESAHLLLLPLLSRVLCRSRNLRTFIRTAHL